MSTQGNSGHSSVVESAPDESASKRRFSARRLGAITYDSLAVGIAWIAALMFRFSFEVEAPPPAAAFFALLWVVPLFATTFALAGLYRGLWFFASIPDLLRILKAVAVGSLATLGIAAMLSLVGTVPRSVFVLFPLFLLLLTGGARIAYRAFTEYMRSVRGRALDGAEPVLVIGAGSSGVMLLRELRTTPRWQVVGVLDDHTSKIGREVAGHRVLGPIAQIAKWARVRGARGAIIAIPSARPLRRAQIVKQCVDAGLHVMSMPSMDELLSGLAKPSALREIGLEDLIGRPQVVIDTPAISELLRDRCVMVTGAGGSIGAELCRQIARFQPAKLVLLDLSEFALYRIDQSLRDSNSGAVIVAHAADVKDASALRYVLSMHKPSVVFHAAAYKHVPLMEELNCWQAIRNNVFGTYQLALACRDAAVEKFVLISTDKAVNPTNVMGASKRLAEMLCQSLIEPANEMQFEIVRFGNVLGSAGSVIPKFQEQIARGGPVTVTHPEITRYFMSIPEAAQLVMQAAAMGRGGEIFVLDMGEPLKVVDVARNLIHLSGYTTDQIKIVFTGLRPGEKLFEELLADSETTRETHHPKLRIARSTPVDPAKAAAVARWIERTDVVSDDKVRDELQRFVPEYKPKNARAKTAQVIELKAS